MNELTIGGLPAAEAKTWTDDNKRLLGEVVCNMMAANPELRRKGYVRYYDLRRHFMKDEWDSYINDLESMRLRKGFRSLKLVLEDAQTDVISPTTNKQEGVHMDGLQRFCEGLRLAGEGLIAMANEIGGAAKAMAPVVTAAPVEQPKKVEPPKAEPKPEPKAEPKQEPKAAPKQEPKAEKIDYEAKRKDLVKLIQQAASPSAKGRDATIAFLKEKFNVVKQTEIPDADLPKAIKAFEDFIAGK